MVFMPTVFAMLVLTAPTNSQELRTQQETKSTPSVEGEKQQPIKLQIDVEYVVELKFRAREYMRAVAAGERQQAIHDAFYGYIDRLVEKYPHTPFGRFLRVGMAP
jgi:hypothetical protein